MRSTWKIATLAVLLAASGCSHSLQASDYSQGCAQDTDCAVIYVGDQCACVCNFGAINKSDLPRYQKDRDAIHCGNANVCGPCQQKDAVCTAGKCAVNP